MIVLAAEGMAVCDHGWLDSVRRITRLVEPHLVTGAGDREMLGVLVSDDERLAWHAARYGQRATVEAAAVVAPAPALTLFGEAA